MIAVPNATLILMQGANKRDCSQMFYMARISSDLEPNDWMIRHFLRTFVVSRLLLGHLFMRANSEALATSLQPVSWLSFLLLLVTGGGIVVYYDKEKKRHIEGRLLW